MDATADRIAFSGMNRLLALVTGKPSPGLPYTAHRTWSSSVSNIWTYELQILGSNGWTREDLEALLQMVRDGALRPVIDCALPLQEAREGLRLLEDREVIGKVVITP